jgi:hypothetical protein
MVRGELEKVDHEHMGKKSRAVGDLALEPTKRPATKKNREHRENDYEKT